MTASGLNDWAKASRLAERRRDVYRLLARLYVEPPPADAEGVAHLARTLGACCGDVDEALVGDLVEALEAADLDELSEDYQALLVIQTGRNLAPIESVYASASYDGKGWRLGRLRARPWAAVRNRYAAAGYEVDAEAGLEADHVACELEFLGHLCDAEARAWAAEDADEAMARRAQALAFVTEHPATWIRRLRQRTADLARTSFYRQLPLLVERFLGLEARHLQTAS